MAARIPLAGLGRRVARLCAALRDRLFRRYGIVLPHFGRPTHRLTDEQVKKLDEE